MAASLRIGAIESMLHSWLIPWIERLRGEQAGLGLELTVETTPVLMDQIQRGAQDIVFAALPGGGDGVRNRPLPAMPMASLLAWRHSIASALTRWRSWRVASF